MIMHLDTIFLSFLLLNNSLIAFSHEIQIYGALRMSVKMHLMWNSKMVIHGGQDAILATSLLEASNLLVLRVLLNFYVSSAFDMVRA